MKSFPFATNMLVISKRKSTITGRKSKVRTTIEYDHGFTCDSWCIVTLTMPGATNVEITTLRIRHDKRQILYKFYYYVFEIFPRF